MKHRDEATRVPGARQHLAFACRLFLVLLQNLLAAFHRLAYRAFFCRLIYRPSVVKPARLGFKPDKRTGGDDGR